MGTWCPSLTGGGSLAVRGWSEGGQYALAVACALGGRVRRCAVVAGCLPLDDPSTFAELNRLDRTLSGLSRHAPPLLRGYFRMTSLLSAVAPRALVGSATRGLPSSEADAVRAPGRWLAELLGEGARQPRGGVDEYRTMTAPWGFAPEDVAVPVRVFQGGADALVPEAWGRTLAERIPGATLALHPDDGHFISLTRSEEILRYLAGSDDAPPA